VETRGGVTHRIQCAPVVENKKSNNISLSGAEEPVVYTFQLPKGA